LSFWFLVGNLAKVLQKQNNYLKPRTDSERAQLKT